MRNALSVGRIGEEFIIKGAGAPLSRIRPAGQRMGNQNSYRRRDPEPRSVGQPGNLCLAAKAGRLPGAWERREDAGPPGGQPEPVWHARTF